jgi:hypothetical protein
MATLWYEPALLQIHLGPRDETDTAIVSIEIMLRNSIHRPPNCVWHFASYNYLFYRPVLEPLGWVCCSFWSTGSSSRGWCSSDALGLCRILTLIKYLALCIYLLAGCSISSAKVVPHTRHSDVPGGPLDIVRAR